jgi:hypothetical protein
MGNSLAFLVIPVYTKTVAALTSADTLIIFAQAPAGLGHLRVTDALYHGLPPGSHAVLLGSDDRNITFLHNLTTRNMELRRAVEYFETGEPQDLFAKVYRWWLGSHTGGLTLQFKTILDRHPTTPKTVVVVATHFGLAHQFAAIKDAFQKKHNLRIYLFVVVTDDSPLHVWAVAGADAIVVPSEYTRQLLEAYHRRVRLTESPYITLPYMVSGRLAAPLAPKDWESRRSQLAPGGGASLHIAVPISGAAVQLGYLRDVIEGLSVADRRCIFHIVSKISPATKGFLANISTHKNVELFTSYADREVVDLYEKLYEKEVIALEITKPSEQAFKALITPKRRGGAILLFSDPVGRQEQDNLNFLSRHGMLGDIGTPGDLTNATHWRAVRLPSDGKAAALAIKTALSRGIFAAMATLTSLPNHPELASDGIAKFWKMVEQTI